MSTVRPRSSLLACGILLVLALPRISHAQFQQFEGQKIAVIRFDPEQQPLDSSELHQILPLKAGEPLRADTVRESIARLFATGRYADIAVDAEPYQGGVSVTFQTKHAWFIGGVRDAGKIDAPPGANQLASAGNLDLGQPYTEPKLHEAEAAQQRLMELNGLFRPTLHPVFEWDDSDQQVNIHFEIDSGPRAHFAQPVITGDMKVSFERILKSLKFRRWIIHTWKPMTQTRIQEGLDGVRNLYLKQNRLEAKVSLDGVKYDAETNSATPSFHIDAGPHIDVRAIGAKLSNHQLHKYVPVFQEHAVDNDLLVEGAQNLRDYLETEGYFDADVQFKQQRVINDEARIDYLIATGDRRKVTAIVITGNKVFDTNTIRERMYLRAANFLQFPHGRYSENLVNRDEDSIRNLYQSNGYRDVKVTHRIENQTQPGKKIGGVAIYINIEEGSQYRVGKLTVTGIDSLERAKVLDKLSSIEGQPFSEYSVALDRDAILDQYFEKGFAQATFEWNATPAAEPFRIDVSYAVTEGGQEFVRQVIYTGNRHAKPQLINRMLELNPGDPLSPLQMTDTQRRLYDLNIFSRVDTAIQDPDGQTNRKYVLYDLQEGHRYTMRIGVGAEFARIGGCQTCLDAPAGQAGFSPRFSFDITRGDLWGEGHSITLGTRVSTLEQRALATYTWPRFRDNPNLTLTFNGLYDNARDILTFSYKRVEGSIRLNQQLGKGLKLSWAYTNRRVSIDQSTLKISSLLIPLLSQPVRLGLISGSIIEDHRDDPVEPHKGYYFSADLGLAEHFLGSQRDFARLLVRHSSYYRLSRRFVLARSTQFGEIFAFHYTGTAFDSIPLPERFFAGGDTSNRGFPELQSGPRDLDTGFPIGGTASFFNQTELRFPLIGENIGAVLFHDMGNTFDSLTDISFRVRQRSLTDFNYMVHAIGFGLRYRTPVGPLRVDLGYSINPPKFFGFNGTEQQLLTAGVNPCATPGNCTQTGVSHFQYFFSIGQTF
ncbi:MAG TPA: POTRA domain-containing protein [Bryobacteraceae bacterium]|nr:POTRA domain-containing protein [Bryobacteraceae bacterium]